MIDLGISKIALIGAVALIVIGPEKLPRVARSLGQWLGKAQRYVTEVKAEVNRSMELDELRKMKETMESAAREVQTSVRDGTRELEQGLQNTSAELNALGDASDGGDSGTGTGTGTDPYAPLDGSDDGRYPTYQHPKKNWRLKTGAVPQWYKARAGIRGRAQSGAARVARFRPHR